MSTRGGVDRRSALAAEDEARRVGLPADAQGMDLEAGFPSRDGGADLEHVGAQGSWSGGVQVVGVVLQEGHAALSGGHDLHRAHEAGGFPVALGAETVAIGHKPLAREAGELRKPVEVLEGVGIGVEIPGFKEGPHAKLHPGLLAHARRALARFRLGRHLVLAFIHFNEAVDL